MELLRRYSNLDTIQEMVRMLHDSGALSPNGQVQMPSSPRIDADPPEPFKLNQRLKPNAIAEIVEHYQAGECSTSIATTFNISKGSVIKLLREAGVQIRNQGLTDEQIAEAVRLYESGLSLAKIGAKVGVDHGTVRR